MNPMNQDEHCSCVDSNGLSSFQSACGESGLVSRRSFLKAAAGAASLTLLYAQPRPARGAPLPWWEREQPLTIIDDGSSYTGVVSPSPDQVASEKASLAFNTEHLHVMGMAGGLDDQEFYFNTKLAGKKNQDYLAQYLPEAKKRGLRVIIYFNVHWFRQPFGEQHRDWLQIREDGGVETRLYGLPGTRFCMNSPWREWVFQITRDLCAYSIDGIFYDGPSFRQDTCYCHYCQDKFQRECGRKLPSKKKRQGKDARDLLDFQVNCYSSFLRDARRTIKAINPEIVFYCNGGVRGGNWTTARLNRILVAEQDMIATEGGYIGGDMTRVPLWRPSVAAKLLETQAPDKPRVVACTARPAPWQFGHHSEPELRLLHAGTVANAGDVFFFGSPHAFRRKQMRGLAEMNRFVAQNAAYYRRTRSEATTALVWSDNTANFYPSAAGELFEGEMAAGGSAVSTHGGEFPGLADTLTRSHTPFDVIDDVTLEQEKLERYSAIFLPGVACMSDEAAGRLKDYVRQGGNLFATFETSLYDETGIQRADFALAEVFGITNARKIVENRWHYWQPRAKNPLLEGWPSDLLAGPVYRLTVNLKGAEALATFTLPMAGGYAGIPQPSDHPAVVLHRYGKGKVVYVCGDIGSGINAYHVPEWAVLIENVLREMAPSPVVLENAPRSVEVVLRSQEEGRRLLLHLINFTGEMTRPIRSIVPLENLLVTLRREGPFKSIRTLMRRQTLTSKRIDAERLQFVVPHVEEYEVVVLERS